MWKPNRPRSKDRESANHPSDGDEKPFESWWRKPELCFGTVLLRMGLLWSAVDYLSNLNYAVLRAMTAHEVEGAIILFVTFDKF